MSEETKPEETLVIPEGFQDSGSLEKLAKQQIDNLLKAKEKAAPPPDGGDPASPADPPTLTDGDPASLPDPPSVNWGAFGEDIDDYDKAVSAFGEQSKKFNEVTEQLKKRDVSITDLSKQLKEHVSNIDDKDLYALNVLKKEDPDNFQLYARLKLSGDVNSAELIKLKLMMENPGWDKSPEKVDMFIKNKYNLDKQKLPELASEDYSDGEVEERKRQNESTQRDIELGQMALERDANQIKNGLLKKLEGVEIPATETAEEIKQKQQSIVQERQRQWTPVANAFTSKFTKFPILVSDKDGKENVFMEVDVPQTFRDEAQTTLLKFLSSDSFQNADQAADAAVSYLFGEFALKNQAFIYGALIEKIKSMSEEELSQYHTNVGILKPQGDIGAETDGQKKHRESMAKVQEWLGR